MDDDAVSTTTVDAAAAEAPVPPRPRTAHPATRSPASSRFSRPSAPPSSSRRCSARSPWSRRSAGWVIDHQPPGAKDFVVSLFGTNDKLALEILIVAVALLIGAGVGIVARRSFAAAALTIAAFAAIGFLASLGDRRSPRRRRRSSPAWPAFAGIGTLSWLLAWAVPRGADRRGHQPDRCPTGRAGASSSGRAPSTAASVVAGVLGRQLLDAAGGPPTTGSTTLPPPSETASLPGGTRRSTSAASPRSSCQTTASTGSTPRC